VTRREFGRLGEPLLRAASILPVAKAGPADDERPGESATGLEAEEISRMAAGVETECDSPWMANNR
jgi:hypothetical protein